jgi:6-hydroxynicotinate 3-monooxygenase
MRKLSVAVIGAGMGGLATAAALRRVEIEVTVYEQSRHFSRIGAGIQIGCNAMKVLRAFGLEPRCERLPSTPAPGTTRTTTPVMFAST